MTEQQAETNQQPTIPIERELRRSYFRLLFRRQRRKLQRLAIGADLRLRLRLLRDCTGHDRRSGPDRAGRPERGGSTDLPVVGDEFFSQTVRA